MYLWTDGVYQGVKCILTKKMKTEKKEKGRWMGLGEQRSVGTEEGRTSY